MGSIRICGLGISLAVETILHFLRAAVWRELRVKGRLRYMDGNGAQCEREWGRMAAIQTKKGDQGLPRVN